MSNINARSIVPVDLNSVIYWNAVILAEFSEKLNDTEKMLRYNSIAKEWMDAITAVLWHDEVGAWLDYDLINNIKRDYFYPSNLTPLWTGSYPKEDKDKIVRLILKYLQTMNVMYPGGIPTTKEHTGEQWDYPNAWPPLQHIMIIGLNNTGDESAQRLAFEISEKWVRSNYKAYNDTIAMYEKVVCEHPSQSCVYLTLVFQYDATVPGGHGGGGEYELQLGFGWTNGVVMDLLNKYGHILQLEDVPLPPPAPAKQSAMINSPSSMGQVATGLLALMVSLTAGYIG